LEQPAKTYDGDEPYVFISHSHQDEALVYREIRWLQHQGVKVWYDAQIQAGSEWSDALANAIGRCSRFLYFITPNSVASENCRRELNHAIEEGRSILAVHLQETEVPPGIRLNLNNRQAILKHRLTPDAYRSTLLEALPVDRAKAPELRASEPPKSRSQFTGALLSAVGTLFAARWAARGGSSDDSIGIESIGQIEAYISNDQYFEAFEIAVELEQRFGTLAALENIWPEISNRVNIDTLPAGADVAVRRYGSDSWRPIGRSPIRDVRLALGLYELRLEKKGHPVTLRIDRNPGFIFGKTLDDPLLEASVGFAPETTIVLEAPGVDVESAVTVPSGATPVPFYGFGLSVGAPHPAFRISKYEVTNREFAEFVDGGGYRNADYWDHIETSEQLAEFVGTLTDRTGRTGPATWEFGTPLEGCGELPVVGVSWYEARAYARFKGGDLPTVQQFGKAALSAMEINIPFGPSIAARANFESDSAREVRASESMGPYGAFDLLGNVNEWALNSLQSDPAERFVLGGAWTDTRYSYRFAATEGAAERSNRIGFRVVFNIAPPPEVSMRALQLPGSDKRFEQLPEPLSDAEFEANRWQFGRNYRVVPGVRERNIREYGVREKVQLVREPTGGSMSLYMAVPDIAKPPYLPVIYFPNFGWEAENSSVTTDESIHFADYILRDGRVLVVPVYTGMNERQDGYPSLTAPLEVHAARRMEWIREVSDVIDYLEMREDFDSSAVAFLGTSAGATLSLPVLIEPRLVAGVLLSGGLFSLDASSEFPRSANAISFLQRTTLPVLLLTGQYDHIIPSEAQHALFENLGTEDDDKRWVQYPTNHWPLPRNQMVREIVQWLDKYQGEVSR
jgi:dienelactone hydrolase